MQLVNALTARSRRSADPMFHASPVPPVRYSKTGGTYEALCGAQVRDVTRVPWRPAGPGRRCADCIARSLKLGEEALR